MTYRADVRIIVDYKGKSLAKYGEVFENEHALMEAVGDALYQRIRQFGDSQWEHFIDHETFSTGLTEMPDDAGAREIARTVLAAYHAHGPAIRFLGQHITQEGQTESIFSNLYEDYTDVAPEFSCVQWVWVRDHWEPEYNYTLQVEDQAHQPRALINQRLGAAGAFGADHPIEFRVTVRISPE